MSILPLLVAFSTAAATPTGSSASPEKPKLLVLGLTAGGGVDAQVASALTEQLTEAIDKRGFFQVLSAKEVQTLLGVERQRQLSGCSEEATNCLAELSGALGARFVVSGSLTRVGSAFQLSLQTLDSHRGQPVGRATRLANDVAEFARSLPFLSAEATATPLPPPPSRVLPYSLMGGGGLAVVGGMVLGLMAFQREATANGQLKIGETRAGVLGSVDDYRAEAAATASMRTGALLALLGGSALLGGGIYLNLFSETDAGGAVARLSAAPSGIALAGVFH